MQQETTTNLFLMTLVCFLCVFQRFSKVKQHKMYVHGHVRNVAFNCSSARAHNTSMNSYRLHQVTTTISGGTNTAATISQNATTYFADSIFLTMCAVFSLALIYSGRFLFKSFSYGNHTNCQLTFIYNSLSKLTKEGALHSTVILQLQYTYT